MMVPGTEESTACKRVRHQHRSRDPLRDELPIGGVESSLMEDAYLPDPVARPRSKPPCECTRVHQPIYLSSELSAQIKGLNHRY